MREKFKKILQILINTALWGWIIFALICLLFFCRQLIHELSTKSITISFVLIQFCYIFIYFVGFSIFIFLLKRSINFLFTEKFYKNIFLAFLYFIILVVFIYIFQCIFPLTD